MSELRFEGDVALVTGAGRGLGRAYAIALAARGARVMVNDAGVTPDGDSADPTPADQVVAEIKHAGGEAVAGYGNVVDGAETIVADVVARYGRLDIVVNNAGVITFGAFADLLKDEFDRILAVTLGGSVSILRAAWPHLIRSGHGRVVNVSSAAVFGMAGEAHYITAKAGVFGLTRALSWEGREHGINVNAIMPVANTRLMGGAATTDPDFQAFISNFPPESVAPFVVWLAHRDTAVTGETFSVGAGRAARVFLGAAPGVIPEENSPEGWRDRTDELLVTEGSTIPASIVEELAMYGQALAVHNQPLLPTSTT